MYEVTPYMVSVATKRGISVIYHSLPWYINYIPQCGTFDLNHRCGIYIYIYMYHFYTSDQRKASAYISHIAPTQNVNEIYALLPVRISH